MELVAGARSVVVAMVRTAKGEDKIATGCTLPLTAERRVSLLATEMAVIEPTDADLVLRKRAPGVSVDAIPHATGAPLIAEGDGAGDAARALRG